MSVYPESVIWFAERQKIKAVGPAVNQVLTSMGARIRDEIFFEECLDGSERTDGNFGDISLEQATLILGEWRGLGGFELLNQNGDWICSVYYSSVKEDGLVDNVSICYPLGSGYSTSIDRVRDISTKIFRQLEPNGFLIGDLGLASYFTYVSQNFDDALTLYREIEHRKEQGEDRFSGNWMECRL